MVRIDPDGDVLAKWSGKFKLRGVEYEVVYEDIGTESTSVFKGNIAPLKVYEDENGKDHRKLYFITMGSAMAVDQNGGQFQSLGYVTGWINKDHTCFGKLWLPQGLDGSETVYEWETVLPGEER
jgi:cyclophilin family peptidyl-prolyl cis-trans isomerase